MIPEFNSNVPVPINFILLHFVHDLIEIWYIELQLKREGKTQNSVSGAYNEYYLGFFECNCLHGGLHFQ